ncbi:putative ef hand domain-protein [Phialemonium atrogriseum]|uniref:Ef hand domain-protein n=1 Tax=Phialemonium atrogriseum TaxID=1093897 RepID=A0AAJ0FL60_9PEZI|nr:putative ef hand domain-protein [Phialemonium atrogriseum]KAK1767023.1 putative ef hand domain-protein [Phialemonium atrogriseum]
MDTPNSAASTLTGHRINVTLFSAVAAASIGYFLYRAVVAPPLPQPGPGQNLHRSNAVRRRRRSHHEPQLGRRPSDASTVSSHESHGDENVDHNLVPPLTDAETIAEEHTMDDEWWNDPSSMPQQRAGQNIVGLLFRVSEDNARRNAYVHRGCACNVCGIVPIRGIRYRCANCADFDLCETCETQGLHIKTHIFYKVKIPAPPFGPRQMQPVWYPGDPETCLRNLPKEVMVKLSKETGFERPELEAFWEQWTFMANTEWREDPADLGLAMDRKTFERCLVPSGGYRHTAPNLIHDRMFSFYDTNNDDLIGFTEFLHGLSYRKRKDKLRKIFDGYDIDRDGLVNRRDFLRVFRAYYVLYKQMHKDILEGLDDQVMSSTEAHQLVSGRQPISSLFGREGRVPRPEGPWFVEGKAFLSNGEDVVTDGKIGVVNEDKPDTADRETILKSLFTVGFGDFFLDSPFSPAPENPRSPEGDSDSRYWRALLNPPTRVDELPPLISGELRDGDELFTSNRNEAHLDAAGSGRDEGGSSDTENPAGQTENVDPANQTAPEDEENEVAGDEAPIADAPRRRDAGEASARRLSAEIQSRSHLHIVAHSHRAALNKRAKVNARRKLLERWKRRQFYLDEEEGAAAPEGWDGEDDILAQTNGVAESSKAAQHAPISPRSRSSSKVRFAEEPDDYEIRSNPSTSSRSVPERWGGMDIPDAERDAGKEILYQVTQQAFNELLDILFKAKEDLAIEAAETKALREEHRSLFESINLDEEDEKAASSPTHTDFIIDEFKPTEDVPLDELLAASGYTVDESFQGQTSGEANDAVLEAIDDMAGGSEMKDADDGPRMERETTEPSSNGDAEYRDPTMPQFRPNSASGISSAPPHRSESSHSEGITTLAASADENRKAASVDKGKSTRPKRTSSLKAKKKKEDGGIPVPIPRSTLVRWKRLDTAEKEARDRGGWGLLNYEEFERIYKAEDIQDNRLDYLGSWIDFCIP